VLWVSAFLYGSFYFVYMPSQTYEMGLNFKFEPCDDGGKEKIGVKCSFLSAGEVPGALFTTQLSSEKSGRRHTIVILELGNSQRLIQLSKLPEYNLTFRHFYKYCLWIIQN
jgi:hypothetical protein